MSRVCWSMVCPEVMHDVINVSFYAVCFLTSLFYVSNHVMKYTSSVLSKIWFHLTRCVSNRVEYMVAVSEEDRLMPVSDVSFIKCKTLGIKWCVATDQLYFNLLSALIVM